MKSICVHGSGASGVCNLHIPAKNWLGVIDTTSGVLLVDGKEAAVVGDSGLADCGHRFVITTGSSFFTAPNGKSYAGIGDTVEIQGTPIFPVANGSGIITSGSPIMEIA